MCFPRTPAALLPKALELSCWNINGLSKRSIFGNKLCNDNFLNYFKNCDIIILSEIWGHEIEDIPNFDIITLSPPQKSPTAKSGRFSGGILIAVKPFITPHILLMKKTPNYIWCKLDKFLFQTERDILLCSCYIPPKESAYFDPDILTNLEHDINIYQRDYSVILAGVFNARTGMENEFTVFDSCKFAPSDNLPTPKEVPARKNFDQHLNEQGKILLEICKSLDLRILNGRCKGDSFGKITFHGKQGISTVDYIIVSHDLMDKFQNFVVRQPSPFSDHSQLISWIKISNPSIEPSNSVNKQELTTLPRQYKWSHDSKDKFITALQSPEVKQIISDFENLNLELFNDVNMAVSEFVKILDLAAKMSLQPVNIKKKRSRKFQIWYDSECHKLKKRLKHVSNRKHNNPSDEKIREAYHLLNKEYKSLLRQKKRNHQNTQMEELINTNNSNQFWSKLKDMSANLPSRDTSVPVDKLHCHFQRLHSKPESERYSVEQEHLVKRLKEQDTPKKPQGELDEPVTETEVRKAVKSLKTKKAAGLDRIRNEMLKSGINHLISSLVKLFNFIITKGSFPDVWSKGLISPIFKAGSKSDPNNYRGICVTSCLGKLFSSLLNTRLSNYFHENNVLHHSQIGFLKGYRTTDHIFSLRTLIDKYVINENKGKLFCCFIDFQKAFDSVWHEGLLLKLIHNKIGVFFITLYQTCI